MRRTTTTSSNSFPQAHRPLPQQRDDDPRRTRIPSSISATRERPCPLPPHPHRPATSATSLKSISSREYVTSTDPNVAFRAAKHPHQLILTPLYFTSFLISLFLVNRSDRARRASSASRTSTVFSYLWPSAWIDPEPYQDPVDTTWDRRDSAPHVEPHAAISPRQAEDKGKRKRKSWHLHRNIRKVARLEISDAFEMRGRVMLGMLVVLVGLALALWWGLRWVVARLWWR